uniref:Uncharacterized protein n=1 Tax=Romanomermis culicivorax TaxID=13658 RepID=A0A915J0C1_ROMCU
MLINEDLPDFLIKDDLALILINNLMIVKVSVSFNAVSSISKAKILAPKSAIFTAKSRPNPDPAPVISTVTCSTKRDEDLYHFITIRVY